MSWMSSLICLMRRSWMLKDVMMFVSICSNIMTCLIVWISGLLLGFSIIVCVQKVWKLLSWWLGNFHFLKILKIWKSWKFSFLKIWKIPFSENLKISVFWKTGNSENLEISVFWKSENLKIWKFRFSGNSVFWKSENLKNSIFWKIGNSGNFGFLKNWKFLDHEFLEKFKYLKN